MRVDNMPWFLDYCRVTDDYMSFNFKHFIKDFLFQHRIRCIVYLRYAQTSQNRFVRLFCNYKLYKISRRYGLEIRSETSIGAGFCMQHPYNITVSTFATIGRNCTLLKGATVGVSQGKHPGAPIIGDSVYVGINSTIIGGIHIGDDVLIAPNTLVNCDVPSHSIVIGSPCRIISRDEATKEYIRNKIYFD